MKKIFRKKYRGILNDLLFLEPRKIRFKYSAQHCTAVSREGRGRQDEMTSRQTDRERGREGERQHKAQCTNSFLFNSSYAVGIEKDKWEASNQMNTERERERSGIVE